MFRNEDLVKLFLQTKNPWDYSLALVYHWFKDKKHEYVLTSNGLASWQSELKPMGADRVEALKSKFLQII